MQHDDDHGSLDPRILAAADEGCEESRSFLTRRAFMGVTASFSAWAFLPRSASAAGSNLSEKRLLVVLLQGGLDGLHVVPPIGDASYASQRRGLALNKDSLKQLGGGFYLTPSMPNFFRAYADRQASVVHAIAPPLRVRSHFECMYNLESGFPGELVRSAKSGWMNRLLNYLPQGQSVSPGGLRLGAAPLILTGPQKVMSWTPERWARSAAVAQKLYDTTDPELADLLQRGDKVRSLANRKSNGTPIVDAAFHGAGNIMAQPDGPRIAAMQIVGFDTHVGEAAGLAKLLAGLDSWLQDYRSALGEAAWANTVVACVSEFGRTVWDNGRNGTDHGTGTVALLYGGAVDGGKVVERWPGLAQLQDGRDLKATICTRELFKGILQDHLGITRTALDTDIFPGSEKIAPLPGLIKAS